MAEHHASASVPASHPCLAGHFPGRPVVPGVVILELVTDAARAWLGLQLRLSALPAVKFLSPLSPDEIFDIHLKNESGQIRFSCSADGRQLANGALVLA